MKINHRYQKYRRFHIIPHELQFGYGYTHDWLQCVRVRVWYGKIPSAVYPCSTLLVKGTSIPPTTSLIVATALDATVTLIADTALVSSESSPSASAVATTVDTWLTTLMSCMSLASIAISGAVAAGKCPSHDISLLSAISSFEMTSWLKGQSPVLQNADLMISGKVSSTVN